MSAAPLAVLASLILGVVVSLWAGRGRRREMDPYRSLLDVIEANQREYVFMQQHLNAIAKDTYRARASQAPPAPPIPEVPMQVLIPGPAAEDNPCPHDEVIETRSLCDANPTCMCALCGANLPHLEDT